MESSTTWGIGSQNVIKGEDLSPFYYSPTRWRKLDSDHFGTCSTNDPNTSAGWRNDGYSSPVDERQGFLFPGPSAPDRYRYDDVDNNIPDTPFQPAPNHPPRTSLLLNPEYFPCPPPFSSHSYAIGSEYSASSFYNSDDTISYDLDDSSDDVQSDYRRREDTLGLGSQFLDSLSGYQSAATSPPAYIHPDIADDDFPPWNYGTDAYEKNDVINQHRAFGIIGTEPEQEPPGRIFGPYDNDNEGTFQDQNPDDSYNSSPNERSDKEYRKHLSRRRRRYGHNEERFGNANDEEPLEQHNVMMTNTTGRGLRGCDGNKINRGLRDQIRDRRMELAMRPLEIRSARRGAPDRGPDLLMHPLEKRDLQGQDRGVELSISPFENRDLQDRDTGMELSMHPFENTDFRDQGTGVELVMCRSKIRSLRKAARLRARAMLENPLLGRIHQQCPPMAAARPAEHSIKYLDHFPVPRGETAEEDMRHDTTSRCLDMTGDGQNYPYHLPDFIELNDNYGPSTDIDSRDQPLGYSFMLVA